MLGYVLAVANSHGILPNCIYSNYDQKYKLDKEIYSNIVEHVI